MIEKKIDIFNIGLIIGSLIIAFLLPFKLFLFSYAILGPLHYLTEISWLHEKKYFVSANRKWVTPFIILTILLSIYPTFQFFHLETSVFVEKVVSFIGRQMNVLLLIAFLFSVGLIFFKKNRDLIAILFILLILAFLSAAHLPGFIVFVAAFLPNLIHVYIFTLLFILYGALKNKSRYGIYLAITLFVVPFIIVLIPIDTTSYQISTETQATFISSGINVLSMKLAAFLDNLQQGDFQLLSEIGLRIQIFIAFAYTYHYLNWFSKTSIIGWKKAITKKRALLILFIWIVSVGIYLYDFKTGFIALLFLSFLHVLLEFPLNVLTIKEVFLRMRNKLYR